MERSTIIGLCVAILGFVHQLAHAPDNTVSYSLGCLSGVHEPKRTTVQRASSPTWTSSSAGDVSNITLPTESTRDVINTTINGITTHTRGINTTSDVTNTTSDIIDRASDTMTGDVGKTNTRNQSRLLRVLLTLPTLGTNDTSSDERPVSVFPDSPDLNATPSVPEYSLSKLWTFFAVPTTEGLSGDLDLNVSTVTAETLGDSSSRQPRTHRTVSTVSTKVGVGELNNIAFNSATIAARTLETSLEHPQKRSHESRAYSTVSTATTESDSIATVWNTTTTATTSKELSSHIPTFVSCVLIGSVVIVIAVCCLVQVNRRPRVAEGIIKAAEIHTLRYRDFAEAAASSSLLTGRTTMVGRAWKSRRGAGTGARDVEAPLEEEGVVGIGMVPLRPVGVDDHRGGASGSSLAGLGSRADWVWVKSR